MKEVVETDMNYIVIIQHHIVLAVNWQDSNQEYKSNIAPEDFRADCIEKFNNELNILFKNLFRVYRSFFQVSGLYLYPCRNISG